MKCNFHSEVEAIGTCVGCGKAICDTCKMELEGKYYCKGCVTTLAQKGKSNIIKNIDIKSFIKKRKVLVVLASILLILLFGLMYFHIVDTSETTILIPKEHLSFKKTFIKLKDWLDEYNSANIFSKSQYSYLDTQFKKRKLIYTPCSLCNGTGQYSCVVCKGKGEYYYYGSYYKCNTCAGKGKYTCPTCKGKGRLD